MFLSLGIAMEEEISHLWGNLSLSEDEQLGVTIPKSDFSVSGDEDSFCLVGRLLVEKHYSKEAFHSTMASVWGLIDSVTFHEVGNDALYIMQFTRKQDRVRIWEGRPLLFDKQLLAFQLYEV